MRVLLWCALLLALGMLLLRSEPDAAPATPGEPRVQVTGATASADGPEPLARDAVVEPVVPLPAFASFDGNGSVITGAIQDGIVLQLRSASGVPLEGARLRAFWSRLSEADGWHYFRDEGMTDARGELRTSISAEVVRRGDLDRVEADVPGFGSMASRDGFFLTARPPHAVVIVVPDVAHLTVRVTDEAGAPLAGASVRVDSESVLGGPGEHVLVGDDTIEVTSDVQGKATMEVPAGRCSVFAECEGHTCPYELQCNLPAGPCEVHIVARSIALRTVTVRVELPPGIDSEVELRAETSQVPTLPGQPHVAWVSGDRRWFSADEVGPHTYRYEFDRTAWHLAVEAEGCAPWSRWIEADEREVTVALARDERFRLRLHVTLPDGSDARGFNLFLHEQADAGRELVRDRFTGGRHDLVLDAGPPCMVQVAVGGFAPVFLGPFDRAGGTRDVKVAMAQPGTVRGTLLDAAGKPILGTVSLYRPAGALAQLDPRAPAILATCFRSDVVSTSEDGTFELRTMGPGLHRIEATPEGLDLPAAALVRAGDTVVLRSGEGIGDRVVVQGTVVDPETRAPLAHMFVEGAGPTDAQGRFTTGPLPVDAEFAVNGSGRVHELVSLQGVPPGVHRRVVELARSVPRFVRLVDAQGRPVEDAEIRVERPDKGGRFRTLLTHAGMQAGAEATTDANGRADLLGLPAGPHVLRVQRHERGASGFLLVDDAAVKSIALPADAGVRTVAELRW